MNERDRIVIVGGGPGGLAAARAYRESWSNGWDETRFVDHAENGDAPEGAEESFTVWYGKEGVCVGVLSHNHDDDYDEGRVLVERGAPLPR